MQARWICCVYLLNSVLWIQSVVYAGMDVGRGTVMSINTRQFSLFFGRKVGFWGRRVEVCLGFGAF